jgi:tetratricopeptide (TPR) repeat protein
MHDLVRDYATTIAARDLTEPARRAALDRVVDFYLHTAHIADRLLDPYRRPIELDPPVTGAHPQPLADIPAALTWLAAEHAHLLAAQDTAVAHHRHHVVWQLAWTLYTFHYRRGHHHDNLALWRVAADAADRLADPSPRALVHRHFGIAHVQLGLHEKATEHLHHALTLAERDDDLIEQANAHRQFAWVREQQGDDGQALKHAERALDLYRALGQPVGEVRALTQVGWYAGRLGDYEMARVHGQTALALNRQHYSAASEADILHTLGWIDQRTGRHRQAIDRYRQAIALFHTVGDTVSPAGALDQIGLAHAALGEDAEAREAWQEAVRLYREQGRDADADRVQRQLDDLDNTVDDRDRTS